MIAVNSSPKGNICPGRASLLWIQSTGIELAKTTCGTYQSELMVSAMDAQHRLAENSNESTGDFKSDSTIAHLRILHEVIVIRIGVLPMEADISCELLSWDSEFFGFPVARVTEASLRESQMRGLLRWANDNAIRCIYYLMKCDDVDGIRVAHKSGFHLVDVRVELECLQETISARSSRTTISENITDYRPGDLPSLQQLARGIHRNTRFYKDPHFPRERCHSLYETWITKSCCGWADAVLIFRIDTIPVGYISCHVRPGCNGSIGLVGVAHHVQRHGVGKALLSSALDWFRQQGISRIMVATQANNPAALRMYENEGFRVKVVNMWWHLWL